MAIRLACSKAMLFITTSFWTSGDARRRLRSLCCERRVILLDFVVGPNMAILLVYLDEESSRHAALLVQLLRTGNKRPDERLVPQQRSRTEIISSQPWRVLSSLDFKRGDILSLL